MASLEFPLVVGESIVSEREHVIGSWKAELLEQASLGPCFSVSDSALGPDMLGEVNGDKLLTVVIVQLILVKISF